MPEFIFISDPCLARGRVIVDLIPWPDRVARSRVDTLIFCDHNFYHVGSSLSLWHTFKQRDCARVADQFAHAGLVPIPLIKNGQLATVIHAPTAQRSARPIV